MKRCIRRYPYNVAGPVAWLVLSGAGTGLALWSISLTPDLARDSRGIAGSICSTRVAGTQRVQGPQLQIHVYSLSIWGKMRTFVGTQLYVGQ